MKKWESSEGYKNINRIIDILGVILTLFLVVIIFMHWKDAPDIIPIHYNIRGEIDGYGSRNIILYILPIALIIYMVMSILGRYPQIYNYAVKITPKNKQNQYNMASTFMRVINIEVMLIFVSMQMKLDTASTSNSNLFMLFLPIELIIIFGSIAFYIYKSIKNK